MPENKPGHWESIAGSFNPRFYVNIAKQPFGRSFVYVLLLSFALSLLFSAKYTLAFSRFVPQAKKLALKVTEGWPQNLTEIKIENGKVSSPVPQPFVHKIGDFTFVLDTTGKVNSLDGYSQAVLMTGNKLVFKTKKSEQETDIKEYSLSKVESFILQPGNAKEGVIARIAIKGKAFNLNMDSLKSLFRIFFIITFFALLAVILSYYLTVKIIQASIFAVLALPANKVFKANLTYSGLFNIALYVLTPATLVSAAIILSGVKINFIWLLYCLIYGAYLILGIKATGTVLNPPLSSPGDLS